MCFKEQSKTYVFNNWIDGLQFEFGRWIGFRHMLDIRVQKTTEKLGSLAWQLCRHIIDTANKDSISTETLRVLVTFSVVQAKRMVYCRTLLHEFNGTTRVGRYIAYRH